MHTNHFPVLTFTRNAQNQILESQGLIYIKTCEENMTKRDRIKSLPAEVKLTCRP